MRVAWRFPRVGLVGRPRPGYLSTDGSFGNSLQWPFTLDVTRNPSYFFGSDSQLSRQEDQRFCFPETGQGIFRIERPARLKLDRIEAATSLRDLAALPGNRFEALVGDRRGQ